MQNATTEVIYIPSPNIIPYFNNLAEYIVSNYPNAIHILNSIIGYIIAISIVISVILFIGIIYCVEKLKSIRREENKILYPKIEMGYEDVERSHPEIRNKWVNIIKNIELDDENAWRQAILEADIILDGLLTELGYQGESIGEKLKRIDKADFKNFNNAWEAHKIRNAIAHEGSNYPLSKYEAKRIINLYGEIFKEFIDL